MAQAATWLIIGLSDLFVPNEDISLTDSVLHETCELGRKRLIASSRSLLGRTQRVVALCRRYCSRKLVMVADLAPAFATLSAGGRIVNVVTPKS